MAFSFSVYAQSGITTLPNFNGDGKSDLLWNNPVDGQTVAWLMDGTAVVTSSALLADPAWKVVKTADLNGAGNTDLIVYNESTGQTLAWIMNGTTVTGWTILLTAPDWTVIETADLNGDGKTDLLWYNATTGQTAAWLMDGASVTSRTELITDADWKVIATADLNGDHTADLIWYNASLHQTTAWLMNSAAVTSWSVLLTNADWKVISTGDFNGDGKVDLLWYNSSTGRTAAWLMDGTSTVIWSLLPNDPNWKVAATADLDGDGKTDIVFSNTITGEKIACLMNGISVSGSGSLLTSLDWSLAAAADLNNDGKADLLWYNSSTGQTAAWLMSGTSPTGGANLFTDPNWRLKCIKGTSVTAGIACDDSAFSAANGTVPVNQPPIVNAGADQSIMLPSVTSLAGNASDDGAPIALLITTWSQVSGPGTVTFGNASSLATTASYSDAGTYTLRLTANDSLLSTSDELIVNVAGLANQAPVVNAGPDQIITLPASANLAGTATDDGMPNGSSLTVSWSMVSGGGIVTFGNMSSLSTTAAFSTSGSYTLRLTASDSLLTATDDVIVTVAGLANQAPVVNAGPDQIITLPAAATMAGTATDDGLPNGSTLTRTWTKVSGPGTVMFGNVAVLNSTATFSVAGSYTLRLAVSDSSLSSSDDVIITVVATQACGNTVSGTLTLSAIAFDNVGVVGVQLKSDGANLGAELTIAPYSIQWNTTTASNGCHTLSAVARDAAGNQGVASIQVIVSNSLTQQQAVSLRKLKNTAHSK